jgi:hypothetical protein
MTVNVDELGPVDWTVVEFPGSKLTGEIAPVIKDYEGRGLVKVPDLLLAIASSAPAEWPDPSEPDRALDAWVEAPGMWRCCLKGWPSGRADVTPKHDHRRSPRSG